MPTLAQRGGMLGRATRLLTCRRKRPASRRLYFRTPRWAAIYLVTGVTKDSTGAPLGSCIVELFQTGTGVKAGESVSDENGNFTIRVGYNSGTFYLVAYKAGAPDVAGVSLNTLVAV